MRGLPRSLGGQYSPIGRADIHFHALPGVDDGPASLADSLELARAAVEDGSSTVVATPHVTDVEQLDELPARVALLNGELAAGAIPLEVRLGGEVAPRDMPRLDDAQLAALASGPLGAKWVLLEATTDACDARPLDLAAARIRNLGLGVVIAHPERSPALGTAAIAAAARGGALVQLNAGSLLGVHGRAVCSASWALIGEIRPSTLVASDAHSRSRPPLLTAAYDAIRARLGGSAADELVDARPRLLVDAGFEHAAAYTASTFASIAE